MHTYITDETASALAYRKQLYSDFWLLIKKKNSYEDRSTSMRPVGEAYVTEVRNDLLRSPRKWRRQPG